MVNSNQKATLTRQIIQEKVVGKIIPKHDAFGHHYQLPDGIIVDSVTTKLIIDKPHLIKWSIRMAFEWLEQENRWSKITPENREEYLKGATLAHTDVRDDAGDVGSRGHDVVEKYMIEWIIQGERPLDIKELVPIGSHYRVTAIARSAEAIFRKYDCIPVATEIIVGSSKYNCAGSLDALVIVNGKLELWDWKTSNSVSDGYAMQVAAYKKFFELMTGLKIHKCRIMKLDKYSDKFKVYEIPNVNEAFKAFVAISKVYDWVNNGKNKLVEEKNIIKI